MAIINFNRKLVGLLKDYIVNQHNYIKELEQTLKQYTDIINLITMQNNANKK